jgi:hypothetical protein
MNSTKATSAMDNLSNSSQDSMEDPTQLRRVAESEDLEDVAEGQVIAIVNVHCEFLNFPFFCKIRS